MNGYQPVRSSSGFPIVKAGKYMKACPDFSREF